MANPFSGIITSELKTLHKNMISALVEDSACTVPCRLTYEGSKFQDCPDCSINPIGQKNITGNPYMPGGGGGGSTCPTCDGSGKIKVDVNETLNLLVIWNYKKLVNMGVVVPEGDVITLTKIENMPKIERCSYIVFNTDIEEYRRHRFVRDSTSNPIGLGQNPFIYTSWKKSG